MQKIGSQLTQTQAKFPTNFCPDRSRSHLIRGNLFLFCLLFFFQSQSNIPTGWVTFSLLTYTLVPSGLHQTDDPLIVPNFGFTFFPLFRTLKIRYKFGPIKTCSKLLQIMCVHFALGLCVCVRLPQSSRTLAPGARREMHQQQYAR